VTKSRPFPFKAYVGRLTVGEETWPFRFKVAQDASGVLRFLVPPIPYTAETAALSRALDGLGKGAAFFKLFGETPDGARFQSDHMTVRYHGHRSTPRTSHLLLRFRTSKATLTRQAEGQARPFIRLSLRGFEAFPHLHAQSPLGDVTMAGAYPAPRGTRLSGLLQVVATSTPADFNTWRSQAEALALHLLSCMSLAASRNLKGLVQETWDGGTMEETFYANTDRRGTGQPVVHPMMRQSFFDCAVRAHSQPPVGAKNLSYAIEWFAMDAGYTELRLLHAMTALENLADLNLSPAETRMLPRKRFEVIAKAMRDAARAASVDAENAADFIKALPGRMEDLNRRSLADKILLLGERWGVPLADLLQGDGLPRAIRARNVIVHRGWYYEPANDTPESRDLWDHVRLMREIVVRFVFVALGYQGQYLVYGGSVRQAAFPPRPGSSPGDSATGPAV
tara:strand:+ start:10568 stop:11920 length:1353 start_codon:yes stop_codon:yes gene_type:complete